MKDTLNARIKLREPFRPFCPSVLAEATGEYFETDYPSPFMVQAYKIKPEQRERIPAVTHEDGTGRLQTVERDVNPLYWSLLKRFGELSGVPILINTSFNENEPIVNTPAQAIDCFLRTNMDGLAIGSFLVLQAGERQPASTAVPSAPSQRTSSELDRQHLRSSPSPSCEFSSSIRRSTRRRLDGAARQRSGREARRARPRRHRRLQPPRLRQPGRAISARRGLARRRDPPDLVVRLRKEGALAARRRLRQLPRELRAVTWRALPRFDLVVAMTSPPLISWLGALFARSRAAASCSG